MAFLAVFLLAWAGAARRWRSERSKVVNLPFLVLPFIALSMLALIQLPIGLITFSGDAFVLVLYFSVCIICLTLGFEFGNAGATPVIGTNHIALRDRGLTVLAFTFTFGAFVSAVVASAQVFELWEFSGLINRMPQLRRPGGNLGQPNQLATLLLMGIASLLYLYESGKLKALPSTLILVAMCTALAITESRTGILSFLMLCVWRLVKNNRITFRLSPWAIAVVAIGFLSMFWSWPSIFAILQENPFERGVDLKAGSRLTVWPQLIDALSLRPWAGWGLGEIAKAHNAVAHAYDSSGAFTYSHNILLDLALGAGIPIAVIFAGITGMWLWRRIRVINHLEPWYCAALAVPLAVHSMLEFPFAYAYLLFPSLFALGILERVTRPESTVCIRLRTALPLLLGLSLVAAWSVIEYVAIEEDFRVARFEALHVGQIPPGYEKPRVFLLTQLDAVLDDIRISPKPNMPIKELDVVQKTGLLYPWTATQNRYALSLALNGNPLEATRQLRVMRAMHGEAVYSAIRENWKTLSLKEFPQLREVVLP